MATFAQRAAYDALADRLSLLDLDLLIGLPRVIQRVPAAYLSSVQVTGPPGMFAPTALRPTLTLLVNWQENAAAEYQLIDLVDLVANDLHRAQLASICKCSIETINYDFRDVGGIAYRVADFTLVLSQL